MVKESSSLLQAVIKQNVTGIATNLGIVMVNGILQGAGELNDYELSEVSGITSDNIYRNCIIYC